MMEEELYGLAYSTPTGFGSDYSSMAPMPEENLQVPHHHQVDYYRSFEPLAAALGRPDPMFSGSCSAVSESDGANSVVTAGVQRLGGSSGEAAELSSAINAKIASHPLYPKLLQAYIDCQKVGAPPEIARVLDEIRRESDLLCRMRPGAISTNCMGPDPELDLFMETYCDILVKYKSDLTRPFDEAITFLNKMETQLNTLAHSSTLSTSSHDGIGGSGGSSDEELSGGEIEVEVEVEDRDSSQLRTNNEDHELKGKLLRKYSGCISTLKHEFSKKKKKGKLPREAKQILHDWWNVHYKWPYPTESDKITLAQVTGLDQKQINNWFINQRKRHWKPSENMQFAVMDSLYGPCFIKD